MAIEPSRLCPCHGEPMHRRRTTGQYSCVVKRRLRAVKYQATTHGQAAKRRAFERFNARRVRIGMRHVCTVPTAEEAEALNAHIRRRLRHYKQEQRCRSVEIPEPNAS